MRRALIAAAIATCVLLACSRFGTDDATTDAPEDAGALPDRVVVPADVVEAAAAEPADLLGEITYDREDDFERDPIPGAGPMDWAEEAPNTTVDTVVRSGECDDDVHCSPAHAAAISHDGSGAGYLATKLAPGTRTLRFDFAMKVSREAADVGRVRIASIELAEGRVIYVQIAGNLLQLGDATSTTEQAPPTVDLGAMTFDVWARYRFYLNLDTRVVALARDGERFSTSLTIRPEVVKTLARARLGITLVGENQFDVLYDDVGIRELPTP